MENNQGRDGFVDPHALLSRTDWNTVENCWSDVAQPTEVTLPRLLDDDPRVQGQALRELSEAVRHDQVLSSATAPAALFVAAILGDPRTLAMVTDRSEYEESYLGTKPEVPLRVALLDWLGDTAADAVAQQGCAFGEQEDSDAVLDAAPELHDAIRPFLADGSPEVREAALAALLPLLTLPALAEHVPALRDRARALAVGDSHRRPRAVDTLVFWGEDLVGLL